MPIPTVAPVVAKRATRVRVRSRARAWSLLAPAFGSFWGDMSLRGPLLGDDSMGPRRHRPSCKARCGLAVTSSLRAPPKNTHPPLRSRRAPGEDRASSREGYDPGQHGAGTHRGVAAGPHPDARAHLRAEPRDREDDR